MQEPVPQIAEHAFGNTSKTQVVTENPTYAIMLGLRRFGWLTLKQCELRVFMWSMEYANDPPSPHYRALVVTTLEEMEELGLVSLKRDAANDIIECHDTTFRFTKRDCKQINPGDDLPPRKGTIKKIEELA